MVAINFQPQFAPEVESGRKTQTIRQKVRCAPGVALQLFTLQRTKKCRKIGEATCISVQVVLMTGEKIVLDHKWSVSDLDGFARLDGFKDYAEMWAWFSGRYKTTEFVGYLIRWELK